MNDRDPVGDHLAHLLLAPAFKLYGIGLQPGDIAFTDLLPDMDALTDPVERLEAEHVHTALTTMRDVIGMVLHPENLP